MAVTFDAEHPDRPAGPGVAEGILEALGRAHVRATFFVQGRWAEAFPETARRIAEAGHLVGSHSHYHARMPLFSDDGIAEDVRTAETVIRDVVGVDPRPWFRCPFGAGANDPRIVRALGVAGYREVGWHVSPDDWDPAASAEHVVASMVRGVSEHGDGAIVLLHTWPRVTLAALPEAIERLSASGARFVGVDALDEAPFESVIRT